MTLKIESVHCRTSCTTVEIITSANFVETTQQIQLTFSKSTRETLEIDVKYVQS